jgi:hypothetical protein
MDTCQTCGASFEPKPQRSGRFCSAACFWTRGPDGPRKASVKGHRQRMVRDHPLAPPSGIVPVGRLVLYGEIGPGPHRCHWCGKGVRWSKGIGPDVLIVDHLDWNRDNNDPTNLVPSCNSCNVRRAAPGRRSAIRPDELVIMVNGYPTRAEAGTCQTCGGQTIFAPSRPKKFCSRECWRRRASPS